MKIKINEQIVVLAENINIEELLAHLNKPFMGSAVAVNQEIISRSHWADTILNEGDNISLFQAIAGG